MGLVNMIMLVLVCYHQDTDRTRCVSGWEDLSRSEIVTMSVTETTRTAIYSDSHSDNRKIVRISNWLGGWVVCELLSKWLTE